MDDEMKKAASLFGKMGGEALKKKMGSKHFSEMGKKGMEKRWAGHKKKSS